MLLFSIGEVRWERWRAINIVTVVIGRYKSAVICLVIVDHGGVSKMARVEWNPVTNGQEGRATSEVTASS